MEQPSKLLQSLCYKDSTMNNGMNIRLLCYSTDCATHVRRAVKCCQRVV